MPGTARKKRAKILARIEVRCSKAGTVRITQEDRGVPLSAEQLAALADARRAITRFIKG